MIVVSAFLDGGYIDKIILVRINVRYIRNLTTSEVAGKFRFIRTQRQKKK